MGIQLVNGRDFSPDYSLDTNNYLVNEAACKKIGYKDPVGKELTMWGDKGNDHRRDERFSSQFTACTY